MLSKMGSLPSGVVQILFEEMLTGSSDTSDEDSQHEDLLDTNYADIIEAAYQSQGSVYDTILRLIVLTDSILPLLI